MENSMYEAFDDSIHQTPSVFHDAVIETEIRVFYEKVLKELCLNLNQNFFCKIRDHLKNIRSYKNPDAEDHESVSFEDKYDRLAYIFAYGVLHSVIVYDRFSSLLKHNDTLWKKVVRLKKVNFCILGGGPAFEVISVCKLLNSTLAMHTYAERSPLEVRVTVVDMCIGWKKDAEFIVGSAQKNLCDPYDVQINFKFIEADLTTDFNEELKRAIKSSHFVMMCKFLSDVKEVAYSKQEVPDMINRIIESMSFKACLFFLDISGGGLFNKMDKFIDEQPSTARIYGPCLHNCHFLSLETVRLFSDALGDIFLFLECTSKSRISCSTWMKVRNIEDMNAFSDNTRSDPFKTSDCVKEPKLKKKKKIRMKRVLQSAPKLKELYCSDVETESED